MTSLISLTDITLEGPDLSGKTTLYSKLHNLTKYKWNIQDRAEISMAIYSEMYGRNDAHIWWQRVHTKLANLNHRYVILLPSRDLLMERFATRGDELQDEKSILEVAQRFEEAASKLWRYPTCIIVNVTKENQFSTAQRTLGHLKDVEDLTTAGICMESLRAASASINQEVVGLNFVLNLTNFSKYKIDVLEYEKEKEYYQKISSKYLSTIQDELAGNNEYKRPEEAVLSRRFIYTGQSCISYINTQVRESTMTMHVVCRSTDVQSTFFYDLSFLQILSRDVRKILSKTCEIEHVIMNVRLDSGHIPRGKLA